MKYFPAGKENLKTASFRDTVILVNILFSASLTSITASMTGRNFPSFLAVPVTPECVGTRFRMRRFSIQAQMIPRISTPYPEGKRIGDRRLVISLRPTERAVSWALRSYNSSYPNSPANMHILSHCVSIIFVHWNFHLIKTYRTRNKIVGERFQHSFFNLGDSFFLTSWAAEL